MTLVYTLANWWGDGVDGVWTLCEPSMMSLDADHWIYSELGVAANDDPLLDRALFSLARRRGLHRLTALDVEAERERIAGGQVKFKSFGSYIRREGLAALR